MLCFYKIKKYGLANIGNVDKIVIKKLRLHLQFKNEKFIFNKCTSESFHDII
jgi:hypothetical protein